jgi:DNA-binding transcriptional LysR family regulator
MLKLDFDERDLRSLRVFCHVADAGGFAAAEKRLSMSKASISRHIRQVEDRLGVVLCERGPSGFKLTSEGVVALNLTLNALQALERIRPEIDAAHGILSGPLTIGIGEHMLTHPQCRLPEALAVLKQRAPDVRPEIIVAPFTDLDRALREQRVDIAIRGKYHENGEFSYLPLYIEVHRVYVSERLDNKKRFQDLPLVYRSHPYVEQALRTGRYIKGPHAGGLDAIGALIATGYYQGILPTHYGQILEKRFVLKTPPRSPSFQHVACAVTLVSRPLSHRVKLFLNILDELHAFDNQSTNA